MVTVIVPSLVITVERPVVILGEDGGIGDEDAEEAEEEMTGVEIDIGAG